MSLRSTLNKIDAELTITENYDLAPFVNWSGNANKPIHRWYKYREAYSPDLIKQLNLGQKILDPFCGSGSIMLGAAQSNRISVGVDVSPFAVFATKVKLNPLSVSELSAVSKFVKSLPSTISSSLEWPTPDLSISHKVFEPEILKTLQKIRWLFETEFNQIPAIRDFIKLGWLSILETVGSYYKEGNGIKYRNKQRQKGRYIAREDGEWQRKRFGENQTKFVLVAFQKMISTMLLDSADWQYGHWQNQSVMLGSSRELDKLDLDQNFNSVVFSPPYANRFDYFEASKVELWFGNFVNSYEENKRFRKKSTRSHLAADFSVGARSFPQLDAIMSHMDQSASSWKMGVQKLLLGYFDDMFETLVQCKNLLDQGTCHVVVGNSAFAGAIVPTDSLIAMLGLEAGFEKVEILKARHLTVSPQQRSQLRGYEEFMRESIVSFS